MPFFINSDQLKKARAFLLIFAFLLLLQGGTFFCQQIQMG
jgi:hypothetical protein